MTTQRLYYDDAYTLAFDAQIVEQLIYEGRPAVVLDRTYFYPTGGGQPHDTGSIGAAQVIDVQTRAADKAVLHILDRPLEIETAACTIDRARRFDFMQQHTGQHVLTQAFVQTLGAQTVGFHLSPDTVTIDLDAGDLTPARAAEAEQLANAVVFENRPVTTRLIDPDAADGVRMRRVPDALATGGLRVVEVQDFDTTACGGTHVAHTGEIGLIKLLRLEKYKGGTRVEFVCGGRALRAFQQRVEITLALTAALTCALPDLPAQVARLQDDLRMRERTIKTQQEALAEYEAVTLLSEAGWHGDARLVIAVYDDGRDAAALRLLAARLVREPGVIALLGTVGDKTHVVCARSVDLPHDMAAFLKRTLEPLGGKGGGQPQQAQGGAGPASAEQVRAALLAGLG